MSGSHTRLSTLLEGLKVDNRSVLDLLRVCADRVPRRCRLCADVHGAGPLCPGCRADLPRAGPWMKPIAGLDAVWACFAYAYPVSGLIHQGKYRHDIGVLRILGALIAEFADVPDRDADLLVPVPLAPERLRQRGFNQAHELCRPIARVRGLEIAERLVDRRSGDLPQVGLPASIRRRNVRNAFRVQGRIEGASVVIMDDVVTTGATASSLAMSLRAAGAARVSFWACARA